MLFFPMQNDNEANYLDYENIVKGIFIQEAKNRFLCDALINGEKTICYVPSSCHLSNFLSLKGENILLLKTTSPKAKTQYSLFAMPFKRSYILLNSSIANRAVENSIYRRFFSFLGSRKKVLHEKTIDGYKCDLYVEDTNTIIEIKSVLCTDRIALYPTVTSERRVKQFSHILELLKRNKRVVFGIAALNPYVKEIQIKSTSDFYSIYLQCIALGLIVFGCTVRFKDNKVIVDKIIPIKSQ